MGLLDFNFEDPRNLGLLRAGAGMMAQAGDASKPFGMGQAIAYGMDTYANTLESDKKRKLEEQLAQQKIFETQENNLYARNLRQAQQEELQQKTAGMLAKQNTIKKIQEQLAKDPNFKVSAADLLALDSDLYMKSQFQGPDRYFPGQTMIDPNTGKLVTVQLSASGKERIVPFAPAGQNVLVKGSGNQPDMIVNTLSATATPTQLSQQLSNNIDNNLPRLPSFGSTGGQPTVGGQSAFNIPLPSGLPTGLSNAQTMQGQPQEPLKGIFRTPPEKPKPEKLMSAEMQKELLQSDDIVQSSKSIVSTLNQALKLNKDAYSGYLAKSRAVLRSNLPGESDSADATINLDNLMTGQALESLKVIFGAMPTEGERKILLEIQASADKTPKQREDIIMRAIAAAKSRGSFAEQKAKSIRGGTYLTEGVPEQPSMQISSGKTMTMDDVKVTAFNKKISIDDVIKKAKAAGYEIRGQ